MTIALSTTARNARADAITTIAGSSALLRIYSGTRPANPDAAITGTLLAELTCGATFAPASSSGVLTVNAIAQDTAANATGNASHFRLFKSDGTTAVMDGDVAASGSDLNLNTVSLVAGAAVQVSSFVLTEA